MSPNFIENNSTLFAPWGGFKPCASIEDCIIGEGSIYSLVSTCSILSHPPTNNSDTQMYCRCDIGLGGEFCTEMTYASSVKLAVSTVSTLIGFAALTYGVNELYIRGRRANATPVLVAVRFAVLSLLFNFLWSCFPIFFLLGGLHGSALDAPRWIYTNLVIPFTFTITLTSVLVLSLSWRKVVNDWRRYSMHVDAEALALREARIRKFVIVTLFLCYLGGTIAMAAGKIIYGTALTILYYILTIVGFIVSGKNFRREISTSTQGGDSLTGEGSRITAALEYARRANRNVTCGLVLVVFVEIFLAVVLEKSGYPTQPDEVESVTIIVPFLQLGIIMTGVFVVLYARHTRQIGQSNKNTRTVGGSHTAFTIGTNESAFDFMNTEDSKI